MDHTAHGRSFQPRFPICLPRTRRYYTRASRLAAVLRWPTLQRTERQSRHPSRPGIDRNRLGSTAFLRTPLHLMTPMPCPRSQLPRIGETAEPVRRPQSGGRIGCASARRFFPSAPVAPLGDLTPGIGTLPSLRPARETGVKLLDTSGACAYGVPRIELCEPSGAVAQVISEALSAMRSRVPCLDSGMRDCSCALSPQPRDSVGCPWCQVPGSRGARGGSRVA